MEKTFLMVKPDGVQRNLIGKIVERFESKGFQLVGAKLMVVSEELAKKHYQEQGLYLLWCGLAKMWWQRLGS